MVETEIRRAEQAGQAPGRGGFGALPRPAAAGADADANAASPSTGTVACAACGRASAASRAFCSACGAALWEPCLACGGQSAAGEAFCGACGVRRDDALSQRGEQIQAELAAAARHQAQCEFDQAAEQLSLIAQLDHPRLRDWAEQARRQLDALDQERRERTALADAALQAARRHAEVRDYDQARCALEAVPPGLHGKEHKALLAQMQDLSEQATALSLQVRKHVQNKRLADALTAVEQLLKLKPDHAEAQDLLVRLQKHCRLDELRHRDQLCQMARDKIAACAYDEAVALIEQVPEAVRDQAVDKLQAHAAELAWLSGALQRSPWIDPTLLAIAQRLVKLQPGDEKAQQHLADLNRRVAERAKEGWVAPISWASHEGANHVGFRLKWLTNPQRITADTAAVRAALRESPGRFAVAMGLALGGLGLARVGLNLLPREEKGGMLQRLTASRKRKQAAQSAWGIDLGASGLKAVMLEARPDGGAEAVACLLIEHSQPLCRALDQSDRSTLVEAAIEAFLARNEHQADAICLGFPGSKTLSRACLLPPVPVAKVADMIQIEARHQIPLPLETLSWDYHLFASSSGGDEPDQPYDALLVAAQRAQVERYLEPLHKHQIEPDVLQSDCIALHNYLAFECPETVAGDEAAVSSGGAAGDGGERQSPDTGAYALLDVGCEGVNLVISGQAVPWSRSIGQGSEEMTKLLTRSFRLTAARAEELKRKPALARQISRVYQGLTPALEALVEQIQRSLDMYLADHPDRTVEGIYCVGGGCQMHGLLRYLLCGR